MIVFSPVVAFAQGYVGETLSQLLISGLGASGTVLLAFLTYQTISNNQELIEEQRKDRDSHLQELMVRKVIKPSVNTAQRNIHSLSRVSHDWTNGVANEGDIFCLDMIHVNTYPTLNEKFSEEHPEVERIMKSHNRLVRSMDECVEEIYSECEGPIESYLNHYEVYFQDPTQEEYRVDPERVINYHLSKSDGSQYDWWVQHSENLSQIIEHHSSKEMRKFNRKQEDIKDKLISLESSLEEAKKKIENEYGVWCEISSLY